MSMPAVPVLGPARQNNRLSCIDPCGAQGRPEGSNLLGWDQGTASNVCNFAVCTLLSWTRTYLRPLSCTILSYIRSRLSTVRRN